MKRLLLLSAIILLPLITQAQVISVFDINSSEFPIVKAKFIAFDEQGKVNSRPMPTDFVITENGHKRSVLYTVCHPSTQLTAISAALVMDASGSMRGRNIQLAQEAARAWINAMPLGLSECAITNFHSSSFIVQDFTRDKNLLLEKVNNLMTNGGTNYNAALLEAPAGGIPVALKGKHKKVVIMLTDGRSNVPTYAQEIIDSAIANDIMIFAVTLGMRCPDDLRYIAEETGGLWLENVTTQAQAKSIYLKILQLTQGAEPCDIAWLSAYECENDVIEGDIEYIPYNAKIPFEYTPENNTAARLEFYPSVISFPNIPPGRYKDTVIQIKAVNADYIITDATSDNPDFVPLTKNIAIKNGEKKSILLRFMPADSGYSFAKIRFETNFCPEYLFASHGYQYKPTGKKTLAITHPNGGESLVAGNNVNITWKGISENDFVRLEYSLNNGIDWLLLSDATKNLRFNWKVPRSPSNYCLARVKHIDSSALKVDSAKPVLHTLAHFNQQKVGFGSWSPDGSKVATASAEGFLRVWETETSKLLFTVPYNPTLTTPAIWSPDGERIAVVSNVITIYQASNGEHLHSFPGDVGDIRTLCWSSDGKRIAVAGSTKTAYLWNTETGARDLALIGHSGSINYITCGATNNKIATASEDSTVIIWHANDGRILHIWENPGVNKIVWSPDNKLLVTTSDDATSKIWVDINASMLHLLWGHTNRVYDAFWNSGGNFVYTLSEDGTVKKWGSGAGSIFQTFSDSPFFIKSFSLSPNGELLATTTSANSIKIWNTATGKLVHTFTDHNSSVNRVRWSPEGARLLSTSDDRTSKIWLYPDASIQEDVSDSLWAIVMPKPLSHDIDIGIALVNEFKDSIVTEFIKCGNAYPFIVDTIYFTGANPEAFSLVSGYPPFQVTSDKNGAVEFRFAPERPGNYSADVVIVTSTDTLIQRIKGIGANRTIEVLGNMINFGRTKLGESIDTLRAETIRNSGNLPLRINSSYIAEPMQRDFEIISSESSFILNPGDTARLDLRFSPTSEGRMTGFLEFEYNAPGSPTQVMLFGEGYRLFPLISALANSKYELFCEDNSELSATISNYGTAELVVSDLSLSNTSEFSVKTDFPFVVLPDSSKIIKIGFNPMEEGKRTTQLEIKSNSEINDKITFELEVIKHKILVEPVEHKIELGNLDPFSEVNSSIFLQNKGTLRTSGYLKSSKNILLSKQEFELEIGETIEIPFAYYAETAGLTSDTIFVMDSICGYNNISEVKANISAPEIFSHLNHFPTLICDNHLTTYLTLSNIGSKLLIINKIELIGDDKDDFSIDNNNEFGIEEDSFVNLAIAFNPQSLGRKNALVRIHSNSPFNPVIEISLSAQKDSAHIIALNDNYELGIIGFNQSLDTSIVIKNFGTTANTAKIYGYSSFIPKINELTLLPGEEATVEFSFAGLNQTINLIEDIVISDTICGFNQIVQFVLNIDGSASAIIKVGNASAYPGENFTLPISFINSRNLSSLGINSLNMELSYNPTLISALDYPAILDNNGNAKINFTVPISADGDLIATELRFIAGLGNSEKTSLSLKLLDDLKGRADIKTQNGEFRLHGICYEGGARLINPSAFAGIVNLAPNPAVTELSIDYVSIEDGDCLISIINSTGQSVQTLRLSDSKIGFNSLKLDLSELSQGIYFVKYQTPTIIDIKKLTIIK